MARDLYTEVLGNPAYGERYKFASELMDLFRQAVLYHA